MPELRELLEVRYRKQSKVYARFFDGLIAMETAYLGIYIIVFNLFQHLMTSQAYVWALTRPLMGYDTYTVIAIVSFICMLSWFRTRSSQVLLVGFALFTWVQMVFGVSILGYTLQGSGVSIVGIFQWISLPLINILILATTGIPNYIPRNKKTDTD